MMFQPTMPTKACLERRLAFGRLAILSAVTALAAFPGRGLAVIWNGTDPSSSATSSNGLTDDYGLFVDESVIYNYTNSTRGTSTYLGNGWVLTARHVVQNGSDYGTIASPGQIVLNVDGTNYTSDDIVNFGSSDLALAHFSGGGAISYLPGVERSQINTNYDENGGLVQIGGYGLYGWIGGSEHDDVSFHRAFNIAEANGGTINIQASGNSRLVQDGYLLGIDDSGDSGSGMWLANGPDQDLDLHDYSLVGITDTSTGNYFGATGGYAQIDGYSGTIISTVFPHAWLTWNANTNSATPTDGSGIWDLSNAHFTDGTTNYVFNGPERTQIATFGAGNGVAGTVTLGANITIDSLTFNAAGSGNYTIAGGGYSLTLIPGSTITTNVNATISAPMNGGSSSQWGTDWEVIKNGSATLTLTGPTILDSGTELRLSAGTTVIATGGSVAVSNCYADVGAYTGDNATLTLSGNGALSDTGSPGDFNIADLGGTGVLNVQGSATLTVNNLYIGKGSSGLTGSGGTGTVSQAGGVINAPYISLGTNHPLSSGTFTLSAGTLFTASVTGGLGSSVFNFNGGTLTASANSATFMQDLSSATINATANINTNGYTVSLNQPLSHAGGPAIDGGLSKTGAGTLILGGESTYTGPTVIKAGTLSLNPAAGAAAVAISPVAWYSFDNVSGTTVVNTGSGGTAMNGTLTGGATIVPGGKFGNAVSLTNGASVVVNNDITDTGGAADWTISAWVRTTTPGASILNKSDGSTWAEDNSVFYLGNGNGGGTGGIPSAVRNGRGYFQAASSTPSVDDGSWHMVTYVDAAGTYAIYTDGNRESLSSGNAGFEQAIEAGGVVTFGTTTDTNAGDGTVNFTGLLDEIQIYNVPLTAAQVQRLYTTDSPNPAAAASVLPTGTPVSVASGATFDLNSNSTTIGSLNGPALTLGNSTNTEFDGAITGSGGLKLQGSGTFTLGGSSSFTGGTTITSGLLKITAGGSLYSAGAINASGGSLLFAASTGTGLLTRTVGAITIAGNSTVSIAVPATHASRTLLVASALTIGTTAGGTYTGQLDLSGNDLILHNGNLATTTNEIRSGYAGGTWTGEGITSSAARTNTTGLTALGVLLNNAGNNTALFTTFDGQSVTTTDVLVKYTYYGDANLDGKVDGSDYSRIDNGYIEHFTGWSNGDFNYDGVVDGSDYTLIDNTFNQQGAQLSTEIATPTAQLSSSAVSVPEPGAIAVALSIAIGCLSRRIGGRNQGRRGDWR
jgi:autotransporter-associated beta strand protein